MVGELRTASEEEKAWSCPSEGREETVRGPRLRMSRSARGGGGGPGPAKSGGGARKAHSQEGEGDEPEKDLEWESALEGGWRAKAGACQPGCEAAKAHPDRRGPKGSMAGTENPRKELLGSGESSHRGKDTQRAQARQASLDRGESRRRRNPRRGKGQSLRGRREEALRRAPSRAGLALAPVPRERPGPPKGAWAAHSSPLKR